MNNTKTTSVQKHACLHVVSVHHIKLTCSPLSNVTLKRGLIFVSASLSTSILYKVVALGSETSNVHGIKENETGINWMKIIINELKTEIDLISINKK